MSRLLLKGRTVTIVKIPTDSDSSDADIGASLEAWHKVFEVEIKPNATTPHACSARDRLARIIRCFYAWSRVDPFYPIVRVRATVCTHVGRDPDGSTGQIDPSFGLEAPTKSRPASDSTAVDHAGQSASR